MMNFKVPAMAVAIAIAAGSLTSIAAPSAAEAGSRFSIHVGHGYGVGYKRYPKNKWGCRIYKKRFHRTGDRYWLGEYYRCLHAHDYD
ncbi:MAG: hypothetical protein AAF468_07885 [Pseudomonadota bacterium]